MGRLNEELEQRTAWALRLKQELEQMNAEFVERTNWALTLDHQLEAGTAENLHLKTSLDQLAWAQPLDRRFHKFLSTAMRTLAGLRKR
jgi:hypothetical protein